MLCKSGLLSRIVQSRHSVCFVCNSWCQWIRHCNRSCEIVGDSHVLNKVSRCFCRKCMITQWRLWTIRDNRPLLQSIRHTADENTDWLYLIRDCRLLFHKNDYSDEFIDTNYYKQNKQNDDFELYVTKDRFYKAYGTLPTKTPTDFDKYVTAA